MLIKLRVLKKSENGQRKRQQVKGMESQAGCTPRRKEPEKNLARKAQSTSRKWGDTCKDPKARLAPRSGVRTQPARQQGLNNNALSKAQGWETQKCSTKRHNKQSLESQAGYTLRREKKASMAKVAGEERSAKNTTARICQTRLGPRACVRATPAWQIVCCCWCYCCRCAAVVSLIVVVVVALFSVSQRSCCCSRCSPCSRPSRRSRLCCSCSSDFFRLPCLLFLFCFYFLFLFVWDKHQLQPTRAKTVNQQCFLTVKLPSGTCAGLKNIVSKCMRGHLFDLTTHDLFWKNASFTLKQRSQGSLVSLNSQYKQHVSSHV